MGASLRSEGSYRGIWSLETFEKINSELPQLVDSVYLQFAVIPMSSGSGYQVVGFDTRLRARFELTDWDEWESALSKIDSRMSTIQIETKKQNKSEMATPRKPSD